MVLRLPPAVPPLPPPFPSISGWVMSWKGGIFSLSGVGPSHSLSVSSESRKPLRAFACSCHVTPLAKHNVNSRSCSETPQLPLQRCGSTQQDRPHCPFLLFPHPHTEKAAREAAPLLWIRAWQFGFSGVINEQCWVLLSCLSLDSQDIVA